MVAYGKMKDSAAFRNLCRARDLKMNDYNEVAKDLDRYKNHPKWGKLIEESKKFLDVIDNVSPHPCAFLLLDKSISEEMGVIKVGDEFCALIDSNTSDAWKYLKNDLLTVSVWNIIANTYKLIGEDIHNIRELNTLIENNDKVWDLYKKGLTATLNRTGTDSATPQVMRYKPRSVRELSGFVAAIRPSFESMKHLFLDRKEFSYEIPEFDEILSTSDNFVLYQENIMATLVYAGFPEDETYGLLKAIAKKKPGIIEPIYERFINGFTSKTGSEENAQKVWKIIEDAVNYGFNSSHSLSVAYDSLYGAYLKAEYPLEYYTVVLNKYQNDTDMTDKIYKELIHFGITVEPIQFGKSKGVYSPDKENNSIIKGLASIKFLNADIADQLLELSEEEYSDFVDLLVAIENETKCNSRQMEILIKLNFFKDFGDNLYQHDIYTKFKERYKKALKDKTKEQRLIEIREYVQELESRSLSVQEQILFEKEVIGYGQTTYPTVPKSYIMALEVDTKFSPRLTFYILNTGREVTLKVNKRYFYDNEGEQLINKGDILKVLKVEKRPKKKKVEGKWIDDEELKEDWLDAWEMSRKYNN